MDGDSRQEPALKATSDHQRLLLELQEKDTLIAQKRHQVQSLTEHAELTELAAQHTRLDSERIEIQTTVDDLTREQKRADVEVEQVRARKDRDEERLNSGAIGDPNALAAIQHELGALERRIGTLEDAELEVMEQLESAQATLDNVTGEIAQIDAKTAEATARRDSATSVLDADMAAAAHARAQLAAGVPDDLAALYEKVRAQYGGLGAAALVAQRCEGCRLQLNGADLREIAAVAEDEVVRCPECSRILVRGIDSGL